MNFANQLHAFERVPFYLNKKKEGRAFVTVCIKVGIFGCNDGGWSRSWNPFI